MFSLFWLSLAASSSVRAQRLTPIPVRLSAIPRVVPHEVGTTTVIAGVSPLDDGRMNIVTIGHERFRLRSVRRDLPYLVGQAEAWPLTGSLSEEAQEQVGPVRALFDHYLSLLVQAQGHRINIEEVPNDPQMVALLVAIALQLPLPLKQRLLAQPTIARMLRAERIIMQREQLILDYMVRTQTDQWEGGYSGYLARN